MAPVNRVRLLPLHNHCTGLQHFTATQELVRRLPWGIHLKIEIIMGYNSLNNDSVDCKGYLYYMTAVCCWLISEIWAWVIVTCTRVIYVTVLMTSVTRNICYSGGNLEFKDSIRDVTWGGIVNHLPKFFNIQGLIIKVSLKHPTLAL